MDGARLSRHPHLSWLGFHVGGAAADAPLAVHMHGSCHTISLTLRGHHDIRWVTRGRECRWGEDAGTIHFRPADHANHVFITSTPDAFTSLVFCIPQRHLDALLDTDGVTPRREWPRLLLPDDAVLRSCLLRLASGIDPHGPPATAALDAEARRLVLRLAELGGVGLPDWYDDQSVFDPRTIGQVVDWIDAHLHDTPSPRDLGRLTGLSPSHSARKFRQTTGVSLARFVNRRRLQAAIRQLTMTDVPLAALAQELGFSSQSHLTRLFSRLTGMPPGRYRRQLRPTMG